MATERHLEVVPLPLSDTDCEIAGLLADTFRNADRLPAAAGVKVRPMLQVAPVATVTGNIAPQDCVSANSETFAPPKPMLSMTSGAVLPALETVTVRGEAVVVLSG